MDELTWYLATCQACTPVLPQPFSVESERDQWATAHESATFHVVKRTVEVQRPRQELTLNQARALLVEYAATVRSRDNRIRAAADAGLSITETAALLEIARTTVYRALGRD